MLRRFFGTTPSFKVDKDAPFALYFHPSGRVTPVTMRSMSNGDYNALQASTSNRSGASASNIGYAYLSEVNVWIRRCMEIRADNIQRLDWYVEDRVTGKRIPDHPLSRAIERTRHPFMWRVMRAWDTWGECYVKPLENQYGYRSDVWWINNLSISFTIVNGFIDSYYYAPLHGGKPFIWQADEVCYMYTFNSFDDLHGSSRVLSVLHEANVHEEIARSAQAHFANDARPGIMFLPENDMGIQQSQEFIDYWNANFQGSLNTNKPVMLPMMIKSVQVLERASLKDDVELRGSIRREICAGFGVPLSVAGAWDDANYQSAPEQRKSLYEETIVPQAELVARALTTELLPFFGDPAKQRVWFDAKKLLALAEDKQAKAAALNSQLTSGGITLNQYRQALDQEALPEGNVFYIPSGVVVTPVEKLGTMPPPAPPGGSPFGLSAPALSVDAPPVPQLPAGEPEKAGGSMAMLLSLSNNTDLIALQKRLKELMPDPSIQWNDPATFHITLVYVPAFDETRRDELVSYMGSYATPELTLNVGSLASFDKVGEHALHFRIPRNAALMEYQEDLYAACESMGLAMSQYSAPANWKPHITMGYAPQRIPITRFQSNLHVAPDGMEVSVERDGKYEVVYRGDAVPDVPEPVRAALYGMQEVHYRPSVDAAACANCRFFSTSPLSTRCLLVMDDGVHQIEGSGTCDLFSPMPDNASLIGFVTDYTPENPNNQYAPAEMGGVDTLVEQSSEIHNALFTLANPALSAEVMTPPEPVRSEDERFLDELDAYRKFVINRWNQPQRAFQFRVITDPLQSELTAQVKACQSKAQVHKLFDGLTDALKKTDDDEDIVTPEQAQEWWGDYDKLMRTLGNDWLRDYMREVWRKLEPRLNREIEAGDVATLLEDFHPDLISKWTGTADDPGVIAKLFMAGMGAGQQALVRKRTNLNPNKASELVIDWELVPSDAIAAVEKYVGRLIRNIDKTTLRDIKTIIAQWLESGGTIAELTKQLSPIFNDPDRAELIATTESSRAYTEGAIERWSEVGVDQVKWNTVRAANVCDICEPLHNQVSTVERGFGAEGFLPPAHPRCRCWIKPVL